MCDSRLAEGLDRNTLPNLPPRMRQIWGVPSPSRTDSEQTQKFRKFGGFLQITECQTQSAEFGIRSHDPQVDGK